MPAAAPVASQAAKAERLLALHHGPRILLLPNAWDAASARIFEEAGFPAIATTSAGIANALGYPDGERISRQEMIDAIAGIAGAVAVPVTADVEAGYGATAEAAAETARQVVAAGAVGLNLEDSAGNGERKLVVLSQQLEKIRAMIEGAAQLGIRLVLNARTDVYLESIGDPAQRFDTAAERLNAYRDAGAACVFAPGVTDRDVIARLVRAVAAPLNILATTGTPPLEELERIGVARVSVGSGPMRATLGYLSRLAKQLREGGDFETMLAEAMPYAEANRLFLKQ